MRESYRRAWRHVDRLPERESILLRATYGYHTGIPAITTAIQRLEEAIRRYPDDVDAWYFLGESYWHNGEQALASQEESEIAFRKMVELDPGFAPAYIHLVNNAFVHRPDSARAAWLIESITAFSPNSASDQENRIAFGLAFGDSIRRAEALAALDTLPIGSCRGWPTATSTTRVFGPDTRLALEHAGTSQTPPGRHDGRYLFDNSMSQGRLRAALTGLESPVLSRGYRVLALYTIHSLELPAPRGDLDQD